MSPVSCTCAICGGAGEGSLQGLLLGRLLLHRLVPLRAVLLVLHTPSTTQLGPVTLHCAGQGR